MDIPALLIPLAGLAVPIVIVPTVMAMKQARIERELEHRERMRALELGMTLRQDESWWSAARIGLAIAGGVPLGVFLCAWLASNPDRPDSSPWVAAGIVGFASVVSGSLFLNRHLSRSNAIDMHDNRFAKPQVDADAFEVAGR
jgi:hypothetical protein